MKKITCFLTTLSLAFLFMISSCGNGAPRPNTTGNQEIKANDPAREIIRISAPKGEARIRFGETLTIIFEPVKEGLFPDSIRVWIDGQYFTTLENGVLELAIDTRETGRVGRKQFRASAYQADFEPQVVVGALEIISDIVPLVYSYKVKKRYNHDRGAYTQGLIYCEGDLYESTGQNGSSSVRRVEIATGRVIEQTNLESRFFGEGLALVDNLLYQLTWTSKVGFVYEKGTLKQVRKIYYQTQGWGLTNLDDNLLMSDGSSKLWIMNPADFLVVGSFEVYDNNGPVTQLNELESIEGLIWANIYTTDRIAIIEPSTGRVTAYVDLGGILPRKDFQADTDVLNGIAYDSAGKRIFVTGKLWPALFEIELITR